DDPDTLQSMNSLAMAYMDAGKLDKALPLSEQTVAASKAKLGAEHADVAGALFTLGIVLLKQKNYAQAEPVLRECLQIRGKKLPDDWRVFNTKSLLGGSLLGQKNYVEAESLLLQGYEGMKRRAGKINQIHKHYLLEARDRLVQLYDAWSKRDKAEEWRKKLEGDTGKAKATELSVIKDKKR